MSKLGSRLVKAAQEGRAAISQPYARELARQVDELESENAHLREQMKIAEGVMRRDRNMLRELAKR